MFDGAGSQTGTRWGDYSMTTIDPSDGMTFWHANEYYATTSNFNWHTRIGKFNFQGGGVTPTQRHLQGYTDRYTGFLQLGGWTEPPESRHPLGWCIFPGQREVLRHGRTRRARRSAASLTNPFEYDPVGNSWTTKSATYPDNQVNNMACGVLNDSGTDYIYCVGRLRIWRAYDHRLVVSSAMIRLLTASPPLLLPGRLALTGQLCPVASPCSTTSFIILGGFEILTAIGTDRFGSLRPGLTHWVQKNAVLPVPLGYIPTTTIGNFIYTGGGDDITGGALDRYDKLLCL